MATSANRSKARQDESASPCSTISCSQLRPLFHIKLERGSNGLVRRRPLTDADDCIKDGQFLSSMVSSEPFFLLPPKSL
ncbi:hypothetical protein NC652_020368 [Populus alba x Populus x berolinensis]|nr:hypothetical protein NC652_020368 [Populus alba x Populus x berolinensis]